jgi:hypothetical protein
MVTPTKSKIVLVPSTPTAATPGQLARSMSSGSGGNVSASIGTPSRAAAADGGEKAKQRLVELQAEYAKEMATAAKPHLNLVVVGEKERKKERGTTKNKNVSNFGV